MAAGTPLRGAHELNVIREEYEQGKNHGEHPETWMAFSFRL